MTVRMVIGSSVQASVSPIFRTSSEVIFVASKCLSEC